MAVDAILLGLSLTATLGSLWSARTFRRARQAARLVQAERERTRREYVAALAAGPRAVSPDDTAVAA